MIKAYHIFIEKTNTMQAVLYKDECQTLHFQYASRCTSHCRSLYFILTKTSQMACAIKEVAHIFCRVENFKNIPEILRNQKQWVAWGVPCQKITVPYSPAPLINFRPQCAKSGVPETWGKYPTAVQCMEHGLAKGIGYEFNAQGIYGIDLDHVIDKNGVIMPEAREIIEQLNSYTEISPSRRGIHIFVTADNINLTRHRRQGGFVEIYDRARYFRVTGNVYEGFDRMADRAVELLRLHDQYLLPKPTKDVLTPVHSMESPQAAEESQRRGLQKDRMLLACWNGERRGGDESASDQALMNKLAYWCNANQPVMLAAFLQSPYYAQKDEAHKKKCQRDDYLPNTAKKACEGLRSTAAQDTARYRQVRKRDKAR